MGEFKRYMALQQLSWELCSWRLYCRLVVESIYLTTGTNRYNSHALEPLIAMSQLADGKGLDSECYIARGSSTEGGRSVYLQLGGLL